MPPREPRPQAVELGKQLDEVINAKHDLNPGQKVSLRKAESDICSQIEIVYHQMADVVTGKTKHDDAVTYQLLSQRNTISDQRQALDCSKPAGFSKANVAVVSAIREKQNMNLKPTPTNSLADDEQQQLMQEFGWEGFGAARQSITLIRQDVQPTSWTGLGNINEKGIKAPFPNPEISFFVNFNF